MNHKMAWEDGEILIPLPDDCRLCHLAPEFPPPLRKDELENQVIKDLDSLSSEIRAAPKIILLLEDGSRNTATGFLTEQILEGIRAIRGSSHGMEVILAAGAHGEVRKDDIALKIGNPGIKTTIHNAAYSAGLAKVGQSLLGISFWFNRKVIEADLRLSVSTVNIHPMAGFSGGGKILLPGVAGLETIEAFHRLPSGRPGDYHSPMRELINEATALLPVRFSWHLISRPSGEIAAMTRGPLEYAHSQGISLLKKWVTVTPPNEAADLVLAGCKPFNQNLLGTFKSLAQLDRVLQPNGTLVLFNEAIRGRGVHYWRNQPGVVQTQKDHFDRLFSGRRVAVYSPKIAQKDFADLFPGYFRLLHSEAELISFLELRNSRPDTLKTVAVIPYAPITLIIK